jgi:RNA polymerase sigma factor (sigma-70 family)
LKLSPTYGEQELVASLKQRDQTAFSLLYDKYSPALYGAVLDIIPDRGIASDVLQEAFVKIWRLIDTYDPQKGTLFTWMFRIARTSAIDMVRSKGWQNRMRNNELSDTHLSVPDSGHSRAADAGLRKAVQQLKEEHKVLVELSYFEGYTQEEISKMLNIPLGTVKTRLRAALVRLRQMITL